MPHLKCVTCRTRYYTPGGPADPIEDLCPGCGSAFEPVGHLSELVGFRAITARDGPQQGLVERLGGLLDRQAHEQARRDRRWAHDDHGPIAEAVALPRPGDDLLTAWSPLWRGIRAGGPYEARNGKQRTASELRGPGVDLGAEDAPVGACPARRMTRY